MTLAIDVHDLSKSFGAVRAVNHVSIQIEQGHITGFLGPNGSGKTTTLRMLCGLLTPDSGSGQVLGLEFPREAAAIKRQTGYMTQRFSLYEALTVDQDYLGINGIRVIVCIWRIATRRDEDALSSALAM